MNIHKKFLSIFLLVTILLVSACGANKASEKGKPDSPTNVIQKDKDVENFPKENNGYPNHGYILINDKAIKLKKSIFGDEKTEETLEITQEEDKPIKLVLPKGTVICLWKLDEKTGYLNSYLEKDIKVENPLEGESKTLQIFEVFPLDNQDKDKQIIFKYHNVNELGKGFDEINESYKLIINVK